MRWHNNYDDMANLEFRVLIGAHANNVIGMFQIKSLLMGKGVLNNSCSCCVVKQMTIRRKMKIVARVKATVAEDVF